MPTTHSSGNHSADKPASAAVDGTRVRDAAHVTAAVGANEPVAQVADDLTRLMRSFGQAKSRALSDSKHRVEWSARVLLARLVIDGPQRASVLADCVNSDQSTVSRQVAAMVKEGLLERQPDPDDGRASLLVATERGQAVFRDHLAQRNEHFGRILAGWSAEECRQFAGLLRRFADDFDKTRHTFFAVPTVQADETVDRGES